MPSKCAYDNCGSREIVYTLTRHGFARRGGGSRTITRTYCSGAHVVLDLLAGMMTAITEDGNKTVKQLYKTAVAVITKLGTALGDEWKRADAK